MLDPDPQNVTIENIGSVFDIGHVFVRDADEAISMQPLDEEDEQWTFAAAWPGEYGRISIELSIPQETASSVSLRSAGDRYALELSEEVEERKSPEFSMSTVPGPGPENETLYGEYTDPDTERVFSYVAVTNPEPVLVVLAVAAGVCLLKIGIEKLATNCTQQCLKMCGEGLVESCTVRSNFGVGFGRQRPKLGCNYECDCKCR